MQAALKLTLIKHCPQNVVSDGGKLAEEEHHDDRDQHDGQVCLLGGVRTHPVSSLFCVFDGPHELNIEDEDKHKRPQEHHNQLQTNEVDLFEVCVASQGGCYQLRD